jgi:hypothetical protein
MTVVTGQYSVVVETKPHENSVLPNVAAFPRGNQKLRQTAHAPNNRTFTLLPLMLPAFNFAAACVPIFLSTAT